LVAGTAPQFSLVQAMDGRVEVSFKAPSHGAEHRSRARGKGAMSEHKDVRVRAGTRPARSAGQSSQPDVGETVMPGANGFGYFCRNKSSPRRWTARKKTWVWRLDPRRGKYSPHPAKC
jgi:hypothetical protein